MTCLGVLDRGERGDDNETGVKEGRGIEMSTTVLPLRDARSLRFEFTYLSSKYDLHSGNLLTRTEMLPL